MSIIVTRSLSWEIESNAFLKYTKHIEWLLVLAKPLPYSHISHDSCAPWKGPVDMRDGVRGRGAGVSSDT